MSAEPAVQTAFAVGVVLVAATIAVALSGRGSRRELRAIAGLLGLAATGGWIVFALDVDRGTAVAAGGLTVCCAAALLTLPLRAGLARNRRVNAELGEALALVERRVEQRLTDWSGDLDRIQQGLTTRLAELAQRQRDAVTEAQSRLETEMEQLKAASEDQRAILAKLREEFERAAGEAGTAARREVEVHESERRRALHEVSERLRQRERELRDRIAAEETEAVRRIQSGFADVERRQIDQLTRIVDRTANRLSEAAVEQFSATVKAARDDAAKRLSPEHDRAVAQFAHDAQSVLAERLAQVSDAGAARVDRKLAEIVGHIEQRRDEFLAEFQRRFSDVEAELRSQIRAVGADAEAEREVLEARVHDLTRRLETAVNAAESSLEGAFRTP